MSRLKKKIQIFYKHSNYVTAWWLLYILTFMSIASLMQMYVEHEKCF